MKKQIKTPQFDESKLILAYFKANKKSGNPSCKPRTKREKKYCR